jgi:hypothetical protein
MTGHTRIGVWGAAAVGLLVAALAPTVKGQSLRSVVEPRDHVFPTVGPGVTAIKRDSLNRYYVLAKPANVIFIYGSDGESLGKIPNGNSSGVVIGYAVGMDLGPDGSLFVADRGANAVEIFNPDGSLAAKVPVVAPTSVVALPDGQFAVTSLTSQRLIQILDERGKLVRSFGEPSSIEDLEAQDAADKPLNDWGKISGSSSGDIYFAFTSLPDPLLRKYDRYGYLAYQASVPRTFFETRPAAAATDRVEFTLNLSHISLSDQTAGWFSVGSSGDLKYGGGMGTGLSRVLGGGGSFGRAAAQLSMWQNGLGSSAGGVGPSSIAGMFSGQISTQGAQFQFGAGTMPARRRGLDGRNAGSTTDFDALMPQGATLQFFESGTDPSDWSSGQVLFMSGNSGSQAGAQGAMGGAEYTGADGGQNAALPAAFAYGAMFNSIGVQPPGAPGAMGGHFPGGGLRFDPPGASGAPGAEGGRPFGDAHFGARGRFGSGEANLTATVRVNLGDIGRISAEKPAITATSVDPGTGELWAATGDTLIHFSKDGNPLEVYYLTLKSGVPLKASAVLVEQDRFLIAADPWGIFEFDRPR